VTLAIGLRFAWPTMLPVSTSVDEVNNYLLADYLVRHAHLPAGADEAASLVEMGQYPFGPHLLVALAARLIGAPAFYLLHPLAAVVLATTAAFAYALAAELSAGRAGGDLAALAGPAALLWPAAYTLGQFTSDFFLAQMFGLMCLVGALYWARAPGRLAPVALVALGAGLVFSYPTLLPIFALGVAWARPRPRDLLLVGLPLGGLAALYLVGRAATGLDVVRQGGVALSPDLATLPPLFLVVGLVGLARATWRPERRALTGFAWAALLQTAAFALAYRLTGELSRYAVEKMVYVLVPLLAVLAGALLAEGLTARGPSPGPAPPLSPRARRLAAPALSLLVLAVALVQIAPRLTRPVDERLPTAALNADLVAAAAWLGERAPAEAPLYLTPDHLSAYWVEIGLLKRDRTAAALPRFHDRVRPPGQYWAWSVSPAAPRLALVTRDADLLVGPEAEQLLRAGQAAVIARPAAGDRSARWIGGELVLLEAGIAGPRAVPGEELPIRARLGTVDASQTDYAIVARLRDWRGEVRGETQQVVASAGVAAGRRLSAALTLRLDPSLPRGAYRVELLPFRLPAWDLTPARVGPEREAAEAPIVTGPVLIAPPDALPPQDVVPRRRLAARFGEQVELIGVDRVEAVAGRLEVDLLWRALRPPDRDYSIFLHLVDADGRLVAQSDGFAWDGAYPTSAWLAGQPLADRRQLPLPGQGPYQLRVGLYRLDGGQRLPVAGGDFVVAATYP
jgi:hypothetical protein